MFGLTSRLVIFGFVTVIALRLLYVLPPHWQPMTSVHTLPILAETWYGPALLLSIPVALGWAAIEIEDPARARILLGIVAVLSVSCVLLIRYAFTCGNCFS